MSAYKYKAEDLFSVQVLKGYDDQTMPARFSEWASHVIEIVLWPRRPFWWLGRYSRGHQRIPRRSFFLFLGPTFSLTDIAKEMHKAKVEWDGAGLPNAIKDVLTRLPTYDYCDDDPKSMTLEHACDTVYLRNESLKDDAGEWRKRLAKMHRAKQERESQIRKLEFDLLCARMVAGQTKDLHNRQVSELNKDIETLRTGVREVLVHLETVNQPMVSVSAVLDLLQAANPKLVEICRNRLQRTMMEKPNGTP